MAVFEYKVVPAPTRGLKAKGVKGTPARFANALETVMNELGADGWEYQRTDTLPVEERQGLTGRTSSFQNMLVFRRTVVEAAAAMEPVAGLIEDQTSPEEDAALEEQPATANENASEETAATPEEAQAETPERDEAEKGDVLTADARDRVAETLQSDGFSFPWSNRRKSDPQQTNLQVEAD